MERIVYLLSKTLNRTPDNEILELLFDFINIDNGICKGKKSDKFAIGPCKHYDQVISLLYMDLNDDLKHKLVSNVIKLLKQFDQNDDVIPSCKTIDKILYDIINRVKQVVVGKKSDENGPTRYNAKNIKNISLNLKLFDEIKLALAST